MQEDLPHRDERPCRARPRRQPTSWTRACSQASMRSAYPLTPLPRLGVVVFTDGALNEPETGYVELTEACGAGGQGISRVTTSAYSSMALTASWT